MFENHLLPKYYSSPKSKNLSFFHSELTTKIQWTHFPCPPPCSPQNKTHFGDTCSSGHESEPPNCCSCAAIKERNGPNGAAAGRWGSIRMPNIYYKSNYKHAFSSLFQSPYSNQNICYPSTKLKMYSQLKKLADVNTSSQHSTKFLKPWIERVFLSKNLLLTFSQCTYNSMLKWTKKMKATYPFWHDSTTIF